MMRKRILPSALCIFIFVCGRTFCIRIKAGLEDLNESRENETEYPGLSYHIGVLSSWKFKSTRMSALYHTWGTEARNITMYVGIPHEKIKLVNNLPIRILKGVNDTVYPPQRKAFQMLEYWCDNLLDQFQWFIRSDDDVYIKIFQLERFLYSLDHNKLYYIGRPGEGKKDERESLGLNGNFYCCGPTMIFSKPALQALCPHLQKCSWSTTSSHEDTELGRCVIQHVKIQCASNYGYPKLKNLFFHQYNKTDSDLLLGNTSSFLSAISIHAVKEDSVMFNMAYHDMITRESIKRIKQQMKHKSNPLGVFQPIALPDYRKNDT